jgi:apurinic endonuclease (APN1)
MAREIGLHLRCNQSLIDVVEKAVRLELNLFQCFLRQQSGTIVTANSQEIATFIACSKNYSNLFVHGSYSINLADETFTHHPALKQELYWAQRLGFTHMVLHSGASTSYSNGVDSVTRILNTIMKATSDIQFVLENVAFAAPSIGGSLEDLQLIRDKLDEPDRLGFCIDTAHAYAFGYDIANKQERDTYIESLGNTVGFDSIKLIHINDTQSGLGSRHDMHCRIGTGAIGAEELKEFALDKHLEHIPLILELPAVEESEEKEDLMLVRSWHHAL